MSYDQLVFPVILLASTACGILVAFTWPKKSSQMTLDLPALSPTTEEIVHKDKAPNKIKFELVRPIEGEAEPVVIKTKTIKKTDEVVSFPRMKPMPRAYFVRSIIKREFQVKKFILGIIPNGTKTKTDYLVRCNAYWSESLKSLEEKIPDFSQELENLKLSDDFVQHIQGVADIAKFRFDGTMIRVILIVFLMSIPFTFLMDNLLHLVPSQIIQWSP